MPKLDRWMPVICYRFPDMYKLVYPSRYMFPCFITVLQVSLQAALPIEPAVHLLELIHKS